MGVRKMTMRKATSKKYNLKKRGKTHKNKNLKKRTKKRVLKRKARSRRRKTKKGGQADPYQLVDPKEYDPLNDPLRDEELPSLVKFDGSGNEIGVKGDANSGLYKRVIPKENRTQPQAPPLPQKHDVHNPEINLERKGAMRDKNKKNKN